MNIETSTLNLILAGILGLQAWIVRKLYALEAQFSVLEVTVEKAPKCRCGTPAGAVAVAVGLAVLGSGCSGLLVPQATVDQVPVVTPGQTNLEAVVSTAATPAGPVVVTNFLAVISPPATNWVAVTNRVLVPHPGITRGLEVAAGLNQLNPLPVAPAINGVLTLLTLGLGWYAKTKNDKAKLLPAIIQGVELAGSPEAKAAIKQVASAVGLEGRLNKVVREVTRP